MYFTGKELTKRLNISHQTLRNWADSGKIKCIKTKGGHRRYLLEENLEEQTRLKIIYARISNKNKKELLEKQIRFLKEEYPNHKVVSDIGTGYKQTNFRKVLECLFARNLEECVITSTNGIAKFRDLFEWIFEQFDSKLIIVQVPNESIEEFTEEFMEIVAIFTKRYYSEEYNSSYKKDKDISNTRTEETI